MFGRKKTQDDLTVVETETIPEAPVTGKGRPTPKRKDQEAARRRPLVPEDRKAAKAVERDQLREQRRVAQAGMAAGDERYLGYRDAGPQRRFARDWVDARFSLGQLIMPVALVFLAVTLLFPMWGLYVQAGMMAFIVACILDFWLMSRSLKKALAKKFGEVQSGSAWYAISRSINPRRMRLPKAVVARGERPH